MNEERPGGKRIGDPEVDRAWRAASNQEPPPQLDAAILLAARSRRAQRRAWQPLAAAATVAGLALVLVQLMPRERDVEAPPSIETAPSAAGVRKEAKAAAEAVAPSAREVDAAAPPDEQKRRDASGSAEAPSSPDAFSAEATSGNAVRAAAPEPAMETSPVHWSARIESLYLSGDMEAAELQLRAFRAAHADADQYLPKELQDWAASVN